MPFERQILSAIFALTAIFIVKKILYPSDKKDRKVIPGLKAKSCQQGNLEDLEKAGSLQEFLIELHKKFGDAASFWLGAQYVVSIASPDLFKEFEAVFNRPKCLFMLFEPLIGAKSIQYANDEDGKSRRKEYDRSMAHSAIHQYIKAFTEASLQLVESIVEEESKGIKTHPITKLVAAYALKVDLICLFGAVENDDIISNFRENYHVCWTEMESRLGGSFPEPGSDREKMFLKSLQSLQSFVSQMVKKRREEEDLFPENHKLIDSLISHSPDVETLISDAISFVVGGFHTTSASLSWTFYFLAKYPHFQERVFREIQEVVGSDEFSLENVSKCVYTKQVFYEALRISQVAPYAARIADEDIALQDHVIKAGTPVVLALGVTFQNPNFFPKPDNFNPDRFKPGNTNEIAAFQPFGIGKRICPGYRFANAEAVVCVATIIRKFRLSLAEGQDIRKVYGLVTHPSNEIYITVEKR